MATLDRRIFTSVGSRRQLAIPTANFTCAGASNLCGRATTGCHECLTYRGADYGQGRQHLRRGIMSVDSEGQWAERAKRFFTGNLSAVESLGGRNRIPPYAPRCRATRTGLRSADWWRWPARACNAARDGTPPP